MFLRMFTRIGCEERPPHFHVEFYPYSSLVITIRRREDVLYVRFSDLLRRGPVGGVEGAAGFFFAGGLRAKRPEGPVGALLLAFGADAPPPPHTPTSAPPAGP